MRRRCEGCEKEKEGKGIRRKEVDGGRKREREWGEEIERRGGEETKRKGSGGNTNGLYEYSKEGRRRGKKGK